MAPNPTKSPRTPGGASPFTGGIEAPVLGRPRAGRGGGTPRRCPHLNATAAAGEEPVLAAPLCPTATIKEGFLHVREAEEPSSLLPRFAFKKRYFWLSAEALSYSKTPEWQVGTAHDPLHDPVGGCRGRGRSDPSRFRVPRRVAASPCRRCGRWSAWTRAPSRSPTSCRSWRRTAPGSSAPPTSSARWGHPPRTLGTLGTPPPCPAPPGAPAQDTSSQPRGKRAVPGGGGNSPSPKCSSTGCTGNSGVPASVIWEHWVVLGSLGCQPNLYWDQ